MEWEQAQLRRGGLHVQEAVEKAPKPVYKPTPSMSVHHPRYFLIADLYLM